MRCLRLSEIDAFLTVMGVRRYHPRPTSTPWVGEVIAIHAGAEPTSWASVARRMKIDLFFRAAMDGFDLDAPHMFNTLERGAIVGTARLVRVLRAGDYEAPVLAERGPARRFLWELVDARAIEPVTGVRARSNLWVLDAETARKVDASPERPRRTPRVALMSGLELPERGGKAAERWRSDCESLAEAYGVRYGMLDSRATVSGPNAAARSRRSERVDEDRGAWVDRRNSQVAHDPEVRAQKGYDPRFVRVFPGAALGHRTHRVAELLAELKEARAAVRRILIEIRRNRYEPPDGRLREGPGRGAE